MHLNVTTLGVVLVTFLAVINMTTKVIYRRHLLELQFPRVRVHGSGARVAARRSGSWSQGSSQKAWQLEQQLETHILTHIHKADREN